MNKIGVIYIGANSVKFTLMNVLDSGYYKIIDECSSDIKLAQDLINSDEISEKKITFWASYFVAAPVPSGFYFAHLPKKDN